MRSRLSIFLGSGLAVGLLTAVCLDHARTPAASSATSGNAEREEKCPVCGMFLRGYGAWIATLRFSDGQTVSFDGVKDLLKYRFDIHHYEPQRSGTSIAAFEVRDYYSLSPINGQLAYYVIGSDVYGPMGQEFIPFAEETSAREFLRDHHGKQVVRFEDLTSELVSQLDGRNP